MEKYYDLIKNSIYLSHDQIKFIGIKKKLEEKEKG